MRKFLKLLLQALGETLEGILVFFGFMKRRPPQDHHDDLSKADVAAAEAEARSDAAAADLLSVLRAPESVVHEYAISPSDTRAAIDLSPLSPEEQDWLLGLSDGDLAMLGASSVEACRKSLDARKVTVNIRRLRERQEADMKNRAPLLRITYQDRDEDKWRHISDVIRERYPHLVGGGGGGPVLKPRCRA
ncbi:hypothetical protein [Gellertiella hungarica]|uniref:Uncharacterized protein n=1 Tax=Gellertiella hungarica TaxID=1572859 RepID=A0A7W6J548_9HYPH|nr:hypothetical protein [Gellertiella hungarica]MBB4064071.1 hypothetical protein [Gellertiella hungarica]